MILFENMVFGDSATAEDIYERLCDHILVSDAADLINYLSENHPDVLSRIPEETRKDFIKALCRYIRTTSDSCTRAVSALASLPSSGTE